MSRGAIAKPLGHSILLFAIVVAAGSRLIADTPAAPVESQIDGELRCEILHRCDVDQQARMAAIRSGLAMGTLEKISGEIDVPNVRRMRQIVARYGWPGKSLVGADGAHAAWLLVQHATHDVKFMEQCVALMEAAVARGEASPIDLAYLDDRVRVRQGKPQRYGTQFRTVGEEQRFVAEPIEDEEHVDERRKALGMPSMAEQDELMRKTYKR